MQLLPTAHRGTSNGADQDDAGMFARGGLRKVVSASGTQRGSKSDTVATGQVHTAPDTQHFPAQNMVILSSTHALPVACLCALLHAHAYHHLLANIRRKTSTLRVTAA